ncbi:hypothetical protein [Devosia ginsengisoli]|uniref:hypothetical protein n=1 Tax=Devosia ginsengisoli TaxID=400770 RepID=UPI0026F0088D|nr:hypothetical protein [Devosia ginsengisoli]MCR6671470.1 hypothetical protein [Devosia ginsengisoli]
MIERPELELDRKAFREIHQGPMASPKDLWRGVITFGLIAVLGAVAGWQLGGFWAALLPIPGAIWLGASLAGIYPRWFFGKPD